MTALDPRRLDTVGASEVGALFSITWDEETMGDLPRETRLGLWARKLRRAEHPDDGAECLHWGHVLEEAIARGLAERHGGLDVSDGGFLLHPRVPGMSATLDFRALYSFEDLAPGVTSGVRLPLEVKNVGVHAFRRWPEKQEPGVWERKDGAWVPATRQPPLSMKLQCLHQAACDEAPATMLGALVGGNSGRLLLIERHEAAVQRIEEEVREFWRSIRDNEPPAPNWALDAETLAALAGEPVPGLIADLRGVSEAEVLFDIFTDHRAAEKVAEEKKKAARAELQKMADDATGAACSRIELRSGYVLTDMSKEVEVKAFTRGASRRFLAYEKKGL